MLGRLKVGQAVALPITDEAGGELRLFTIAPRITPHVRHREKYVDVPVSAHRAFVFNGDGRQAHAVRTLRQLVSELETSPTASLEPYISRGDFSRWIGDVFADRRLAARVRKIERRWHADHRAPLRPALLGLLEAVTAP